MRHRFQSNYRRARGLREVTEAASSKVRHFLFPSLRILISIQNSIDSTSTNIFDDLPALAAPKASELRDELERYLASDPEFVPDVLAWWYERRNTYPGLSRMAMDYLTIPGTHAFGSVWLRRAENGTSAATSVDVERVFSRGRILLSHLRSRLSVQSTRALMCVGAWSVLGYVKDQDVRVGTMLPEVEEGEEGELLDGWDAITRA
jgi:hAT family C-terminal dimerisation region